VVAIKGLEKFSSKDFPGRISSTVFLGGCNFRCPFCHNADLVLRPESYDTLSMDFFLSYLDSRKGWLDGICITGGEPLLEDDLETLARVVKERGLLVKLDTNGSLPDRLEAVCGAGVVDCVAMDIKAPLERYREVTRSCVEPENIQRSVEFLMKSGLEYVFRTTVVPGLVGGDDIARISGWLDGAKAYQIQQFVPHDTIDPAYLELRPFTGEDLNDFAGIARPHFDEVRIEGA